MPRRTPIDRRAVVSRHDPRQREHRPGEPLQLGNGELAVAVDLTGLQTYPDAHPHASLHGEPPGTLLGTMAQWGWHSSPAALDARLEDALRLYETPRGPVSYVDLDTTAHGPDGDAGTDNERALRNNPHRLHLGLVGFVLPVALDALTETEQHLDLWSGLLHSRFTVPGHVATEVTTAVHPTEDILAVRVAGHVPALELRFGYGSESWTNALDLRTPHAHTTEVRAGSGGWQVVRRLDATTYTLTVTTDGALELLEEHRVRITPAGTSLSLSVRFDHGDPTEAATDVDEVLSACRLEWPRFWESGAAVDLGQVEDERAHELERRIVLSQYLTRINCAGSLPPAETGLLTNSWRGRFHLEMHWWHAAHFASWGRPELLERSLSWYQRILPTAREIATRQGYRGARWPKQVGPEARESPSDIGPFLLWQQPHPLHLAELVRRAALAQHGEAAATAVQERYREIVTETAELMADIVSLTDAGYALGPPLVPAQESYAQLRHRLTNPTFELAYWRWALLVAADWLRDLGLPERPHWREVASGIVAPALRDGVYEAVDVEPFTIRTDHPSMVAALGLVPPTGLIDEAAMSRTLDGVLADWDWPSTWGWDYGMLAMTAARLGRGADAVEALLLPVAKNHHGSHGHNPQRPSLPAYLPGNGAVLSAVALMIGGWEGGPPQPGVPPGWDVRHEGFVPAPGPVSPQPLSARRSSPKNASA
jgi:hypothetical protein